MAQLNFTLDYDFLVGLFSESKDEAFGKLMEAILNQVLKAESSTQLCAENYERNADRKDYRNGTRTRFLTTRIGKIELQVPRHRDAPFKTMIFETYQRNEQALISTMMEMVVQGISTRKVEKVTQELCGTKFSKSTVSEICKDLDIEVKKFKHRLLSGRYPFVIADAIYIKVREEHKIVSKAFLIAIGINSSGHREILGFDICDTEKETTWTDFFQGLNERGLIDVDVVISDNNKGLVKSIKECFSGASWQRCQVHFMRNIMDKTPKKYQTGLSDEVKAMFNASTIEEARRLRTEICEEYADVATEAVHVLDEGFEDSMVIMMLPSKYRVSLRTSNIIERLNREIRRREQVIQVFPNVASAIRLIGSVIIDHHNDWSLRKRQFSMTEYFDNQQEIKNKILKLKSA